MIARLRQRLPASAPGQAEIAWMHAGAMISLLLLGLLVYATTISFAFVWDDHQCILGNPAIRDWKMIPHYFIDQQTMAEPRLAADFRLFRPLRNISYLIDYHVAGLNPAWWHLHNILLHVLNSVLVYLVAIRLLRGHPARIAAALTGGLFFLLHPVQTEVVAWVKGRDDLLATVAALAGTLVLLRDFRPMSRRCDGAVALAHLASCLAKVQTVAVLPLIALVTPLQDTRRLRFTRGIVFALISGIFLLWRHRVIGQTAQSSPLAGTTVQTLLQMGPVFLQYIRLVIAPFWLLADYIYLRDLPPLAAGLIAASWLALLAISAGFIWLARRQPIYRLPCVWIAAAFLPVSNLVPMMQFMAERFLYLPMAGIALLLAAGIARCLQKVSRKHQRVILLVITIVLLLLTTLTRLRLPVWRSNLTLFEATVRDAPYPALRPHMNLLAARINHGDRQGAEALIQFIENQWGQTDALKPRERAKLSRSRAMLIRDQAPQAEVLSYLMDATRMNPDFVDAWVDMGVLHARAGELNTAMTHIETALDLQPDHAMALYNRALLHRDSGRPDQAIADFRLSIRSTPEAATYAALAALLWSTGNVQEAVAVYAEGLRHFPEDETLRQWHREGKRLLAQ